MNIKIKKCLGPSYESGREHPSKYSFLYENDGYKTKEMCKALVSTLGET